MLNVVLVTPEIASNTGNIGRTCVVTGSKLHLVSPLGFSLDDKMLKRAGLGYWHSLDLQVYNDWNEFIAKNGLAVDANEPRMHLLTKKAHRLYTQAHYTDGDFLIFGCESVGLPETLLAAYPASCERIPMLTDKTALSDADEWYATAGDTPAEQSALLQQDVCGNFVNPNDYRISALNLSNAAAIVIYEALRQLDFPDMDVPEI